VPDLCNGCCSCCGFHLLAGLVSPTPEPAGISRALPLAMPSAPDGWISPVYLPPRS
jgi:hypothetical protein